MVGFFIDVRGDHCSEMGDGTMFLGYGLRFLCHLDSYSLYLLAFRRESRGRTWPR